MFTYSCPTVSVRRRILDQPLGAPDQARTRTGADFVHRVERLGRFLTGDRTALDRSNEHSYRTGYGDRERLARLAKWPVVRDRDDFLKEATGASSRTLSQALDALMDAGLVAKRMEEAAPVATYYSLTEKGEALEPSSTNSTPGPASTSTPPSTPRSEPRL